MADTIYTLVAEAKRNKYSLIPSLSEQDVVGIWEAVARYITKQMLQQKGVAVPSLGMFTFFQKTIDVGSNKSIVIQHPVFVLSEKLVQNLSLNYPKQQTSGQIPIVPLNYSALANETAFSRDAVETCVREVLQALTRSIAAKHSIEFDFSGVGRLLFREGKVKMRFFRAFITSIDSSGQLESVLRFCPSSCSMRSEFSIMSGPSSGTPRPSTTASLLVLPRIVESRGSGCHLNLDLSSSSSSESRGGSDASSDFSSRPSTRTSTTFQLTTPTKMPQIAEEPDWLPCEEMKAGEESRRDRGGGVLLSSEEQRATLRDTRVAKTRRNSRQLVPKPATLFTSSERETERGTTAPANQTREKRRNRSSQSSRSSSLAMRPSTCSHASQPRQELCYLCHQRAVKNIHVDVTEERREKERVEDKMLQQYLHDTDLIGLSKDQVLKTRTRHYDKEMASFNLSVADDKKNERCSKSSEFHPSYVFEHRALTPAKYLKQQHYCQELDDQVEHKHGRLIQALEREKALEKEEQSELARELATFQLIHQRDKVEKMTEYEKALAEQIRTKPAPVSMGDPEMHQPVFGVHDMSAEKWKEQKQRARKLFLEQLDMAEEKQAITKDRALQAQQHEADMLKRTRNGLIDDLREAHRTRLEHRKHLERIWGLSMQEKRNHSREEVKRAKQPSILLHQQCDKYRRCHQCQRRVDNGGKSNLLFESRYISGARLMV